MQEAGTPSQGPSMGSRLTLGNELSEDTTLLTKQDTFWEGGLGGEQQVRAPRRAALLCVLQARVLWEWGEFPGCLVSRLGS